uniref:DUF538 family protein n=1 Tax=Oryza meridionalis TaxID=40149 RepID=A0A0E0D4U4_9ORYZ
MAMSPLTTILLLAAVGAAAASGAPLHGIANDLLPEYGLPRGLIPETIASYTFDNDTGDFEIRLTSTCYIWFGSHLAYFEDAIRGRIAYGTITGLSGIQAQKFFVWVSITTIVAHPDQGTVEFRAGFISEALPESDFAEVPVCGAGARLRGAAGLARQLGLQLPAVAELLGWESTCSKLEHLRFDVVTK